MKNIILALTLASLSLSACGQGAATATAQPEPGDDPAAPSEMQISKLAAAGY